MRAIHLKKDGVLMSNFISQIISICQFMILIIGVMVLKSKNKVTTNFASLDFINEVDDIFKTTW